VLPVLYRWVEQREEKRHCAARVDMMPDTIFSTSR
jgi:hypothetical protein